MRLIGTITDINRRDIYIAGFGKCGFWSRGHQSLLDRAGKGLTCLVLYHDAPRRVRVYVACLKVTLLEELRTALPLYSGSKLRPRPNPLYLAFHLIPRHFTGQFLAIQELLDGIDIQMTVVKHSSHFWGDVRLESALSCEVLSFKNLLFNFSILLFLPNF